VVLWGGGVRVEFEGYYLHQPTQANSKNQLAINFACGFPSIFASLDRMHYMWKNCPITWQEDFGDRFGKKLIINS